VDGQVRGQVRGQVDGQVGGQVGGQVRGRLINWVQGVLYGQHWAGYYSYFAAMEAIGVTGLEPIRGQQLVARSAGWWWAYRNVAIITERPSQLRRDANGDLHSADGMALTYPDGWGFWAWHGRRVPQWVIEAPDVEKIAAEPNVEVRRCAIESLGWEVFAREAQLALAGSAPDPGNPGFDIELYDVPERLWGSRVRLLLCTNGSAERDGTRRRYGLTTPAEIDSPLEAAGWTYGLSGSDYAQCQRRT
jgi:hypothetical protein